MPDPQDNAKLTGDTLLPEIENTVPGLPEMPDDVGADGTPRDRGQAGSNDGKPGRDENAAGFVKDDRLSGQRKPR